MQSMNRTFLRSNTSRMKLHSDSPIMFTKSPSPASWQPIEMLKIFERHENTIERFWILNEAQRVVDVRAFTSFGNSLNGNGFDHTPCLPAHHTEWLINKPLKCAIHAIARSYTPKKHVYLILINDRVMVSHSCQTLSRSNTHDGYMHGHRMQNTVQTKRSQTKETHKVKNRLLISTKKKHTRETFKIKQVTHCLQFMGKNVRIPQRSYSQR